ncbi:hypothetical protein AB3X93_35765 [Paraburkholderia sp. BR14262]|uniref:hypothetical protein n=1 Tax=Paraburkholderia sp. BR14262 TaxID=3236999 RepID=UPI0034CE1D98
MAQSPFFPRQMPQQTVDASKERLPLILNLSAQGGRQRSFIQRGRSHTARKRPYRLFAAPPCAGCFVAAICRTVRPHSPQEARIRQLAQLSNRRASRLHRLAQRQAQSKQTTDGE